MIEAYTMEAWVDAAPHAQQELREAVHVILASISQSALLRAEMIMKGGILMAIRYRSPRFTTDIDFSSCHSLEKMGTEEVRREMDAVLPLVSQQLPYGLDCRVQSCGINPKNRPGASFPSIELKIGYAYRGTPKHKRLLRGESSTAVSIDFSLNETILAVEDLAIKDTAGILTYALTDLMAEKLRSLLQQVTRDRYRRQDIFDLCQLLEQPISSREKAAILESLKEKSASRGITPGPESLSDDEVKRRSQRNYQTLADEVEGVLPDFDSSYNRLVEFYKSLPWDE